MVDIQILPTDADQPGDEDRRRWLPYTILAAAAALLVILALTVFDGSEQSTPVDVVDSPDVVVAPEPEATEIAENIIGIWHRISSDQIYLRFLEDGTANWADSLETVIGGLGTEWNYRVEGTQFFVEEVRGECETKSQASLSDRPPASTGSYEVRLLENGNLQFVVIEDECRVRVTRLYGRPDDGITREFEPVP